MNCRRENYNAFVAKKLSGWKEVAECGVDRHERARARKNFRRLVLAYPQLAIDCGFAWGQANRNVAMHLKSGKDVAMRAGRNR